MTDCGREPHLHVYPHRAMWRWTYHEPAGEDGRVLELRSSIAFTDAQEARSAATTAYPGTPVVDDEQADETTPEERPKRHRCRRTLPAALAVAVLAGTAVIILRQRALDDHGRDRPDRPGLWIGFGPGFRLRFRMRRSRVTAGPRGAVRQVARSNFETPLGKPRSEGAQGRSLIVRMKGCSPGPSSEDVVMVDLTKRGAALPRTRARRLGGRR